MGFRWVCSLLGLGRRTPTRKPKVSTEAAALYQPLSQPEKSSRTGTQLAAGVISATITRQVIDVSWPEAETRCPSSRKQRATWIDSKRDLESFGPVTEEQKTLVANIWQEFRCSGEVAKHSFGQRENRTTITAMVVDPDRRIDMYYCHLVLPYGELEHARVDDYLICFSPRTDGPLWWLHSIIPIAEGSASTLRPSSACTTR